jgi:hypothetical protein
MRTIDWQLVLEFLKALAGPIATVTAVLIAAKLALRTFLGQKAIERRLEWFGRLHHQVDVLIACAVDIRSLMELDKTDALGKRRSGFLALSEQLRATCDEGALYASQDILHTIQQLRNAIIRFHVAQHEGTLDHAAVTAFIDQCDRVLQSLRAQLRAEMGLPRLEAPGTTG